MENNRPKVVIIGVKTTRRLIRVGDTSLAIVLPISWLRYYSLGYGDSVEVISDGSIEIKPEKKPSNFGG